MRWPSLNPVRLLAGPIFTTEMRINGRHTSTYVIRFLFSGVVVGFFALILVGTWLESNRFSSGTVADLQRFQRIAPQLTTTVIWTQYVGLLLLTPVLTGSAICGERRSRTLAALLTTPLSAGEILLSKLTGRMTQIMILAAISLPLLFAARMLGGLSVEGIVSAALITMVSVLLMASLTLAMSITARKPTSASASGLSLFLLISFAPPLIGWIYNTWFLPRYQIPSLGLIPLHWINGSSMPLSLGMVSVEHFVGSATGFTSMQNWGWSVIIGLMISSLTLLVAGARMRKLMQHDPEGDLTTQAKPRRRRKGNAAKTQVADTTDNTRNSRRVGDQPVLWRETHQPIFRTKRMLVVTVVSSLGLAALLLYNGAFDESATYYVLAMLALGAVVFQSCYNTTGSIAGERETRTLDVLLTTPLRPSAIILGKYFGALRRLIIVPGLLFLIFLLASAMYFHPVILVLLPIIFLPPIVFFSATGMLFGVCMRNIPAAITNVGLVIALYMILPISIAFAESFLGMHYQISESVITIALIPNPFFMSAVAISGTELFYNSTFELSRANFSLPYEMVPFWKFLGFAIVGAVVQLVAATAVLYIATRLLPTLHGRPS